MRYAVAVLCCCVILSCREIQPYEAGSTPIAGYSLSGTVRSVNGIPLDSVDVRLWYNYVPANTPPNDTTRVVVTDPTDVVDIAVFTPTYQFVRQLFFSYRPTGPIPRAQWDFYDYQGKLAPSGKYIVRYTLDTVIMKEEIRIVEGTSVAKTDAFGKFSIAADRLPIGERFDIYNLLNRYVGTYEVTPEIYLELRKSVLYASTTVRIESGRITNAAFTIQ